MSRAKYLTEIDGLRAVAVLCVIIFHFDKHYLPFGYLGVDIFFAISGYVISKSIVSRIDRNTFTIKDFFVRRVKRLLPALACVVSSTAMISSMLMPKCTSMDTIISAFIGLSNIHLWRKGNDYFSASAECNGLTHTWSLGVEEQFYLIFPFVLVFLYKRRLALPALIIMAMLSMISYLGFWADYGSMVFYLAPFRFWELLAGAIIFFIHHKWGGQLHTLPSYGLKYLCLTGLMLIVGSQSLPEYLATVLCVCLSCGILYLSGEGSKSNPILHNPISLYIGRISYSLYLWHWPVVVFMKVLLPAHWVLVAYIGLTVGLSTLSYYGVEKPMRERQWTWFARWPALGVPTYVLVVALFVTGVGQLRPSLYLGPSQMLQSTFLAKKDCHNPGMAGLTTCLSKDTQSGKTIWLVGDSHAGHLLPALNASALKVAGRIQYLTDLGFYYSLSEQCGEKQCASGTHQELLARLSQVAQAGDILVMSFSQRMSIEEVEHNRVFERNLTSFIASSDAAGLKVILVQDVPMVCGNEIDYMRSAFRPEVCSITIEDSLKQRSILSNIYKEIHEHVSLVIVDPHNDFCDRAGICTNWKDNHLLYSDYSPHLTLDASLSLATIFHDAFVPFFD